VGDQYRDDYFEIDFLLRGRLSELQKVRHGSPDEVFEIPRVRERRRGIEPQDAIRKASIGVQYPAVSDICGDCYSKRSLRPEHALSKTDLSKLMGVGSNQSFKMGNVSGLDH
jgi:hypothetical protein